MIKTQSPKLVHNFCGGKLAFLTSETYKVYQREFRSCWQYQTMSKSVTVLIVVMLVTCRVRLGQWPGVRCQSELVQETCR